MKDKIEDYINKLWNINNDFEDMVEKLKVENNSQEYVIGASVYIGIAMGKIHEFVKVMSEDLIDINIEEEEFRDIKDVEIDFLFMNDKKRKALEEGIVYLLENDIFGRYPDVATTLADIHQELREQHEY